MKHLQGPLMAFMGAHPLMAFILGWVGLNFLVAALLGGVR